MLEISQMEMASVYGGLLPRVGTCQAVTTVVGGIIGGAIGFYGGFGFGAAPGASWGATGGGVVGGIACPIFFNDD